jgi:hypothetical protein
MGEKNDSFGDGLRNFVAKLYSTKRYSLKGSEFLGAIYRFFAYDEPLDTENLQSYLTTTTKGNSGRD